MASGTTGWTLTSTYQLISGTEVKCAGIVTGRFPIELWYGPTGTAGSNSGIPLSPGEDFSYAIASGDGLYARTLSPSGSLEISRSAT